MWDHLKIMAQIAARSMAEITVNKQEALRRNYFDFSETLAVNSHERERMAKNSFRES